MAWLYHYLVAALLSGPLLYLGRRRVSPEGIVNLTRRKVEVSSSTKITQLLPLLSSNDDQLQAAAWASITPSQAANRTCITSR